jgi:hypothetical protein
MSEPLSRRKILRRKILTGLGVAAGAGALGSAWKLASRYGLIPPDSGGIWGPGETLTYAASRILMSGHSMAREFHRSQISKVIPVSGEPPEKESYQQLLAAGFSDWRLQVDGMIARPGLYSLDQIKQLPSDSQITHQACEEGWSFIAEWTGVKLSTFLHLLGTNPAAKYVVFDAFDGTWDSLDMPDALHPQTFLAYGLNGSELPARHGAPLRLRVARQLGYKSVKFLSRITVTDNLKNVRTGKGSISPDFGYSWFAGI